MTAPDFRAVDAHTGDIAGVDPELDKMRVQRDEARAELDNMVNLTIEVGRLGTYLQHAVADRDDYREQCDEWRDKYDAAQCRMDELAGELKAAKDLVAELRMRDQAADNTIARLMAERDTYRSAVTR